MHKSSVPILTALAVAATSATGLWATPVSAQEPASAGGSVSLSTDDGASGDASATAPEAKADKKADKKAKGDASGEPWIKRYRPTRNQLELGIFAGLMFPAYATHEIYDPNKMWQQYKRVAPDIGLRLGFYPLSFLGLEIEGAVVPTKVADGTGAFLGGFRGYGLFQLPYRIAPFALIGLGFLGGQSSALGKDIDPALHFGGGVKFYVNRLIALRLDIRDNVSAQYQVDGGRTHYPEILLGLSILLNRKKPEPKQDRDTDGDGFMDSVDHCVKKPGVAPHGCPADAPADEPDRDGDGFKDSVDTCPDNPGTEPEGCPDTDGDGFKDHVDKCPTVPGVAPDGCPPPDTDKDGILDSKDSCINDPETKNGYRDVDGCPDEVPKAVAKFSGVIKGIFFDVNKDTIKPASRPTLDNAVKVLKEFPDVKVEISGHTDADGSADLNRDLSGRRAESVKKYLVGKGIDASRLTTKGYGPDQPIADNGTKKGKAQNRRIEFKLVSD